MNFKNGLVMAKAFDCFAEDFKKEKHLIEVEYLVSPWQMRNRKNTYLNELIFKEVKKLKTPP